MAGMTTDQWEGYIAGRSAYLDTVMYQHVDRQNPMFQQILMVDTMDRQEKEMRDIRGLGLMTRITTEIPGEWPYDEFEPGRVKRFVRGWYGNGTQLSKMFLMEDRDNIASRRVRALVESATLTKEYYAAAHFNNATSTGDYVLPDGKALAATDHPLEADLVGVLGGSSTWSNYVNAVLSQSSLESAIVLFRRQPDDYGVPQQVGRMRLLHAETNAAKVHELLESMGKPEVDTNDANYFRTLSITPVSWPFLQNQTWWGLLGEKHGVMWFDRQGTQTESTRDFDNKSIKNTVDAMWASGSWTWRGFVLGDDGS